MLMNYMGQISQSKGSKLLFNLKSNIKFPHFPFKRWRNTPNLWSIHHMAHDCKSNEFQTFFDMVNERRAQAQKSIVVQVQSPKSVQELYQYCTSLGTIQELLHYSSGIDSLVHFIIVEFAEEEQVNNLLKNSSSHFNNAEGIPVHTNFLWFKASSRKNSKLKQLKNVKLTIENGNKLIESDKLKVSLQTAESISNQIEILHNATKLNDVATRLRFLTTRQIEMCISGMFPLAVAYPFGSTVNGFGKMGCDLDMVLRLSDNSTPKEDNRLIFHCKALNGYERSLSQRHMEVIGDIIQHFLPGCSQIRKILQARVPIIKYYQQLTDVECDLSMSNLSGVHMSDLLHIFGSMDPRIRPLVFAIRRWACEVGLTNSSPGRWITNFSLTLLILAFLQNPGSSPPILPSINALVKQAGSSDKYITEDGVNCTFLRDTKRLNFKSENTETLESLLGQFFEFYSAFNFEEKAISLNEAIAITKPEHSALYIVNPLERGLNVSKNVSYEELEKFKLEVRNAAWVLESQENRQTNWGILEIFENKRKQFPSGYVFPSKQSRLMDVSKLFEEQTEGYTEIAFKDETVEKEVQLIKENTRERIKKLENNNNSRKSKRHKLNR